MRFIGNYSSGKMGYALAMECASRGARVELVSGPTSLDCSHLGIRRHDVRSAKEMLEAADGVFDSCDAAIFCAAVADYAPAECCDAKIKREKSEEITLRLVRNPDIAATLSGRKHEQLTVGFALETDEGMAAARRKLADKNLDWIVLNSLTNPMAGFQKDTNAVTLISAWGEEKALPPRLKTEIAKEMIDTIFR